MSQKLAPPPSVPRKPAAVVPAPMVWDDPDPASALAPLRNSAAVAAAVGYHSQVPAAMSPAPATSTAPCRYL